MSASVFGAPGGGNFGAAGSGLVALGGGAGAIVAGFSGAALSVTDSSGAAVPARHTISFSNVMKSSCVKRTRYVPARRPGMRVGPLAGLFTSRSTGPMTLTVTPSIGTPLALVMNTSAVVVEELEARGRGACVGAGVAGGVAGFAGGCAVCSKVNSKSATIDLDGTTGSRRDHQRRVLDRQRAHADAGRRENRVGHRRRHRRHRRLAEPADVRVRSN